MNQGEAEKQREGPHGEQAEQGERAIVAEHGVTPLAIQELICQRGVGNPGSAVEESRQAKLARDPARKHQGFKRLPQNHDNQNNAGQYSQRVYHAVLTGNIRFPESQKELSLSNRVARSRRRNAMREFLQTLTGHPYLVLNPIRVAGAHRLSVAAVTGPGGG